MNKQLNHEFRLPDPVLVEPMIDPRLERELMRRRIDQLTEANRALQTQVPLLPTASPLRRNRYWAVRQYPWSFRAAGRLTWAIALLLLGLVMALLVEGTLGMTEAFEGTLALTQDVMKPVLLVLLGTGLIITLRDQLTTNKRQDQRSN
ncbi:MAG: hypothetical protein HC860_01210 [Alkalinema sp. RU_4_3]|nr:hypothetical protein [Alkalinema sp. RU_4_3]